MTTARYNFRFYPTDAQKRSLAQMFGCVRVAFNWGLRCQLDALDAGDKMPSAYDLDKALTTLKKDADYRWLNDVSSVPLKQSLQDLGRAWRNCFEKRARRPRFKRKHGEQSARFTKSAFTIEGRHFKLAKIGWLDIRWSRNLPELPTSCTVTLDASGRYHVSFVCEVDPEPLSEVDKVVGVDLGLSHFAILSDGEKVENPRYLQRDLDKLAKAQRVLARKQKGSMNRAKARLRVAKLHARIADKRRDFQHKLSTRLIRENQAIAVETLAVKNMVRNKRLARSISDAGWSGFVDMLRYKAEWYGRTLHELDRWTPTSKTCSGCGHVVDKLPLSVRRWECPCCGADHDRDVNAAMNVARAAGLAVSVCRGETPAPEQLGLFGL